MDGSVLSKKHHMDSKTLKAIKAIPAYPDEVRLGTVMRRCGCSNANSLPLDAPIYQSGDNMVAYISQEHKDRFLGELGELSGVGQ